MENINWLSLILAAIVPMVVGFAWYHKATFGKAWMAATGMTEEKAAEANMGLTFGLSFIMSLAMSFFLLNFNNSPGQEGQFDTFGHGFAHGMTLSLFLIIPVFVTNGLFEQKSWKLILINVGYWALTLGIMSGIIDVMNHWPNEVM
ncbi:MAG: DUF1761 domain-containing protein [Bacteroidia bacterium]|nr:DUF1761 domain-containing protein [Bacteroidia bacterium]